MCLKAIPPTLNWLCECFIVENYTQFLCFIDILTILSDEISVKYYSIIPPLPRNWQLTDFQQLENKMISNSQTHFSLGFISGDMSWQN